MEFEVGRDRQCLSNGINSGATPGRSGRARRAVKRVEAASNQTGSVHRLVSEVFCTVVTLVDIADRGRASLYRLDREDCFTEQGQRLQCSHNLDVAAVVVAYATTSGATSGKPGG